MSYIKYELRKIFGVRYLWYFLAVCLLLNGVLCLYQSHQSEEAIPVSVVSDFFDLYIDNKDRLESEYKEIQRFQAEQSALFVEQMQLGNHDYEMETLPSKYAPNGFSDTQLFSEIFDRIDSIQSYPNSIQKIINTANDNLSEFDSMRIPRNSYISEYQIKIIDLYSNAKSNVRLGFEYTRGWDKYFTYDVVNIFIFAMLMLIGTVIFAQEQNTGFLSIMRVSKNGRVKTALAKIAAMMIITVAVVLLFTLECLAVIMSQTGFGSIYNAIQVYDAFRLCPYVISVGVYFLINLGFKILAFSTFSSVIMLISVVVYNYAITYLCGLGFFGLNFLLFTLPYIGADNPLKSLNLAAVSSVRPLFERYRSINLFDCVVGYIPFAIVFLGALTLVLTALTVQRYCKSAQRTRFPFMEKIVKFKRAIKQRGILRKSFRTYSLSILSAEVYKTFVSSRFIIFIILLFLVKCFIANEAYKNPKSYSDAVYMEYMTVLSGEITEEKREYLAMERRMIDETMAKKEQMQSAYANDEISYEEYRSFLSDYNYAYSRTDLLKIIENHAAYIDRLSSDGKNAWFVYDTGWKTWLISSFDWTIYAAILLLFSSIFSSEYDSRVSSGGFAQILRTVKNGRRKTFISKYIFIVVGSLCFTAIWNMADIIFVTQRFSLPEISAPIWSIEAFENIHSNITIGQYIVRFFAVKILANLLLAIVLCSLSAILKKSIVVISAAVSLTLIPTALVSLGMKLFSVVDYTSIMRATPILIQNSAGMYISILTIISITAVTYAERKWMK
mgnify:CR=1 FL=1